MAVFSHQGRNVPYHIEFVPFSHDILLLQGARFEPSFWRPVLDQLTGAGPGRIVTVEWYDAALTPEQLAEDLESLVRTLGLTAVTIVACEEAVPVVQRLERSGSLSVGGTLAYAKSSPKAGEIVEAIRGLLHV
jgi:hypothetical protein